MGSKKGLIGKCALLATTCISVGAIMSVDAGADTTATTQQGITLKTSELKVNKVITSPKPEVKVVYETTRKSTTNLSRGSASSSNQVVNVALNQLGKPYVYGSSGPNSFDCSGLTSYVFRQLGISIPRTSSSQYGVGYKVTKSNLQPGDLVFFNTYSSLSHVGIYIGGGQFVHASRTGKPVMISNLSEGYYAQRYAGAKRVM